MVAPKACYCETCEDANWDCEFHYDSLDNSTGITKKSLSSVDFRDFVGSIKSRSLPLRATQSFTSALEELRFAGNPHRINFKYRQRAMKPTNQEIDSLIIGTATCPCGCLSRPGVIRPFRTREKKTLALHVVPPEVLYHHGYCYEPCQIALFWKKDCRMFLWKSTLQQNKDVPPPEICKKKSEVDAMLTNKLVNMDIDFDNKLLI